MWQERKLPDGRRQLEIRLNFPLITWNRLLSMQHFQRMEYRHLLQKLMFISIMYGKDWPTQMEFQGKQHSTSLLCAQFYGAIRPSKSVKSHIAKLKAQKNTPSSPSLKRKRKNDSQS